MVGSKTQAILAGDPFAAGHDAATGEALWRVNWIGEAAVELASSPAFANGVAFFTTERAVLVAIKPGEEKPLWKYEGEFPNVSSPVATDKFVIVATAGGLVTCVDAATGNKLWTHEFDDGFDSSPIVVGERVYLMDKKGVTTIFKLSEKYEQLGRCELGEECSCTPAFPQGRVYLRTKTSLICIGKD